MKFSIVVPIYKVEKYLDECIQSIFRQIFADYELILVDDGSPDNCPQMCDEYATKDSRVKVIHQEKVWQASARNAAIRVASAFRLALYFQPFLAIYLANKLDRRRDITLILFVMGTIWLLYTGREFPYKFLWQ